MSLANRHRQPAPNPARTIPPPAKNSWKVKGAMVAGGDSGGTEGACPICPPLRSGGGGPHEVWWRGPPCPHARSRRRAAPSVTGLRPAPPPPPLRGRGGLFLQHQRGPGVAVV